MTNSPVDQSLAEAESGLEKSGRVEDLIKLYERRALEVLSPDEAAHLLARAGTLAAERMKQRDRATQLFERALVFSPVAREALTGLRQLAESGNDSELAASVGERIAGLERGEAAAALYRQVANVFDQKLHRPDRAMVCLRLAARAAPNELETLKSARAIEFREGRLSQSLEWLEKEGAISGWPPLADEAVTLVEAAIGDPWSYGKAIAVLDAVLKALPGHARAQQVRQDLSKVEHTWRDRVRQLKAQSVESRDRKKAAQLSLSAARLQIFFDSSATAKIRETIDRCFVLWPAMPAALDVLEQFAERGGDLRAALAEFQRLSTSHTATDACVTILTRAAQFSIIRLNDAAEALRFSKAAFAKDPSRDDVASFLAERLMHQGQAEEVIGVFQKLAEATKLPRKRVTALTAAARVAERSLKNSAQAISLLKLARSVDANDLALGVDLADQLLVAGQLEEAWALRDDVSGAPISASRKSEWFWKAATAAKDDARRLEAFHQSIFWSPNTDERRAQAESESRKQKSLQPYMQVLRRALVRCDGAQARQVLADTARLEVELGRIREALPIYAQLAKEVPENAQFQAEASRLQQILDAEDRDPARIAAKQIEGLEAKGGSDAELATLYRQVLDREPNDLGTLRKWTNVSMRLGRWKPAALGWEHLVAVSESPEERRNARFALAQLLSERLERGVEAARIFLGLLEEGMDAPALISGLEKLADQNIEPVAIMRALAPLYAKRKDHHRYCAALLTQLKSSEAVEERLQLLTLLARVQERELLDSKAAFESYLQMIALQPMEPTIRSEAVLLANVVGGHRELVRALTTQATRVDTDAAKLELLRAAGAIALERSFFEEAVLAYTAARSITPDDVALSRQLAQALAKAGQLVAAESVLMDIVQGGPPPDAQAAADAIAASAMPAGRFLESAKAFQTAVSRGAEPLHVYPQLIKALDQAREFKAQAEALVAYAEVLDKHGDAAKAVAARTERAKILDTKLGERGQAAARYAEVLAAEPGNQQALSALEQMLEDPTLAVEAAKTLAQAFEKAGEARRVIAMLLIVGERAGSSSERIDAFRRAARLSSTLRQPEQAFAALANALRIDVSSPELRQDARAAAHAADLLESYAEVIEEHVEGQQAAVQVALHRELADLSESALNSVDSAITHWSKVEGGVPGDEEALDALRRLHRTKEQWVQLCGVCERLDAGARIEVRKSALREAALIAESKLSDVQRALGSWRRLCEIDAADRAAAVSLERLAGVLGDHASLSFALELRRRHEGNSPAGHELSVRLAHLRREQFHDDEMAVEICRQVLVENELHDGALSELEAIAVTLSPAGLSAFEACDQVLARRGLHQRRIALREAVLEQQMGEQIRDQRSAEIRLILEHELGQPEAAFMHALKSFAAYDSQRAAVQPDLERLAHVTNAVPELVEVYESVAESLPAASAQRVGFTRRAAALTDEKGTAEESLRLWQRVVELVPQDREALARMAALLEQAKNSAALADVTFQRAQAAKEPSERQALLATAAEHFETAGNDARALEVLEALRAEAETPTTLAALERAYGRVARVPEQAKVLLSMAAIADATEIKIDAWVRAGQLFERINDAISAADAFASALSVNPHEERALSGLERLLQVETAAARAADVLAPLFRGSASLDRLAAVLEAKLSLVDVSLQVPVLQELASVREALGEKAAALSLRLRAFTLGTSNPDVRQALDRLATEQSAFEELAAAYEDALEAGVDAEVAVQLWRRLGFIYSEKLDRPKDAQSAFDNVLKADANDAAALDELSKLYRKTASYRELTQVLQKQLALETSPEKQIELLFEIASVGEDQLADKQLAAQCYGAVLQRSPGEPNAVKLLDRALIELERWADLATLLQQEIDRANERNSEEHALELLVRLGRLKLTRLDDARGALTVFQDVLRRRPKFAAAVGALEEMARSDSPLKGEAASAVEPVFSEEGDHLKAVQMLEAKVAAEPQPGERANILRTIADTYAQKMNNPAMGFVAAARALREVPDDEASLAMALKLYRDAEAADEMIALLGEVTPRAANDASRARLFRALGQLQTETGETEDAAQSWKRVLELVPTDTEALRHVGALLAKQGKAQELVDVLKRQLTIEEDTEKRVALMLQIGSLQETQLKDAASALATFKKVLELKPEQRQALERLDVLCEVQQRWPELADVVSRRLKVEGPDKHNDLTARLAVVRETKLLDKAGALELYGELLALSPTHQVALPRVEAIVQREPQNQVAVELLLKVYRSSDPAKLAQLIETRVSVSPDAVERKTLLAELAAIRDAQSEPELAYLALYRAFREDPNDSTLRKKLEAAAKAASSWDELAAAYEAELPRIAENSEVAQVCMSLGQMLETHLKEPERAVEFYAKAKDASPELAPKALAALDRLYGQLDNAQAQSQAIEALAALATDPQEKSSLYFRVGQLAMEKLNAVDQAAAAFEKVLEADPKHLPSLRSLETLYEQVKSMEKLYKVLEVQRDLAQGPERERVLGKMAVVSAEGIGNIEHSITLYRELLSKNPRNDQAFAALNLLLEKAGKFEELRDLLATKLQTTIDPRELVRLNERLGRIVFERLKKPEDAINFFKAALERDARHQGALEALRDIFEVLEKREDLIIILRRLIPVQPDATGVKNLRIRLAEVIAHTSRREESLDAARRALEVEPHNVADLDRIQSVFVQLKAWADAVRVLELRASVYMAMEEREGAVQSLFQVADLWRNTAGKPENAGPALEKILEIDPANRQAYEQALALYSQVNDWRSYAQAMDRYLPNLVTDDEKVATLRSLAQVQEQKLGQKDVAFLQVCRALQLTPSDDSLREQVERLADETESYEELAAVYEEVADALPRGPLAERMYLTLARVQDTKIDDADAAEAALRKVLEFDPTNEAALERLASMFARRGRNKEYVVSLEQKLEAAGGIEKRKEILREIARVYDEQMNDLTEAEGALQRALELEPDQQTLLSVVGLQKRQDNHAGVASTLLRMRDLAQSPEERSRIQVDVATVYERDLQDDEAAVEGFRQALEFDPANPTALEALERLYSKLDRPAELLAVYERQIELAQDYRDRIRILFKCASIWEERYQNLQNADACIDAALQIEPQNIQAIKALERLRKAQGRWDELIGVVDRHIQLLTNPAEKAELCVEMGDIFHQQLKAVDRAVTAYHQALELDAQCRPAMHALGMLYERSGNWPFALEMLEREAQVLGTTPEAVELWFRMGKINEDMLIDAASAKRCYLESLKIDSGYLPSIRALKSIYENEKDYDSYEKALIEEAKKTEDPVEKSGAFLEVAKHYEKQENADQAIAYYEEALKLVPDSLDAARPLADMYLAKENWERCEQMLDIVTAKLSTKFGQTPDDTELSKELCRRYYRSGYVCEKNGRREKALNAYEKAYQLDATYLPVLEGYGNLLVQTKRYEEALKVYQSILLHHRGDLTDLEVAEIYWVLGDLHFNLKQHDRAENHFEKALSIDGSHEPTLKSMVALNELKGSFDRAAEFRQKLLGIVEGDAKFENGVALGKLAKERLNDPYMAIDAYLAAHRTRPEVLEVMDALYVLYRETKQGAKGAEILERMLQSPALQAEAPKAKRVWFALGELARDELMDLDKAVNAFNAALDLDWRFIEAFSALEAMLGKNKKWKTLDDNYKRMLARFPKTEETHLARMTIWRALGDMYLNVMKAPDAAVEVYKVVATGMPDNVEVQEQFAALAQTQAGYEQQAADAWRRALPTTNNPGKVASALAELAAKRKDYDSAWLAAQIASGLIGEAGQGEKEILTKLGPYAKKKEIAQRALTDRLWQQHLFHPKVRGPLSELLAILFEQAGTLYKEDFTKYAINPKKHFIDVATAQEYQIHHYRYVSRILGFDQVAVFSPFLVTTRDRMAKKTNEPAPDPMLGVDICHTDPIAIRFGGKFFSETGQKEIYYLLGRTLALMRPELALAQRISAERLEAVVQAAISLSVERFRFSADMRAIDTERKALDKQLTEPARAALSRVTKEYVKVATPNDLRNYLEGAEFSATRAGAFVAGDIEPVKRMVMAETGSSFRVQPRSKIRDLMVFALGEDLHALRVAVGTNVEVQLRK